MGQAQINVRIRACSRTSIARTKQAALTHNVRGKELKPIFSSFCTYEKLSCFLRHVTGFVRMGHNLPGKLRPGAKIINVFRASVLRNDVILYCLARYV